MRAAQLRSRRRAGRAGRPARSTSPGSTRKPSSPSRTTSGTPPTRVATTGQPLASASIAVTGVPSFAEGRTNDVEGGEERADVLLVAGEEAVADDPELARQLLDRSRSGPSPTMQRHASTPSSRSERKARSTTSVALHGRSSGRSSRRRTGRRGSPSRRAWSRARVARSSATRASSSIPRRMTRNFDAGATPSATSSSRTSGLTATSASVTRASRRSSRRKNAVQKPAEVAAQHVAVERVHDDRRPCAAGEQRRERGRPRPPSPCACAGSSGAAARIIRASRKVASRSRIGEMSRCRCGIVTTGTPELLGDVGHRLLALADAAGDEGRLVAALARGPAER